MNKSYMDRIEELQNLLDDREDEILNLQEELEEKRSILKELANNAGLKDQGQYAYGIYLTAEQVRKIKEGAK